MLHQSTDAQATNVHDFVKTKAYALLSCFAVSILRRASIFFKTSSYRAEAAENLLTTSDVLFMNVGIRSRIASRMWANFASRKNPSPLQSTNRSAERPRAAPGPQPSPSRSSPGGRMHCADQQGSRRPRRNPLPSPATTLLSSRPAPDATPIRFSTHTASE